MMHDPRLSPDRDRFFFHGCLSAAIIELIVIVLALLAWHWIFS